MAPLFCCKKKAPGSHSGRYQLDADSLDFLTNYIPISKDHSFREFLINI
jgi:hypothetical protein